jgi:hypothetical protein
MGIGACAEAPPSVGAAVTGVAKPATARYAAPDNWLYYQDPAGFHVAVPREWRVWHIGRLLCFRDPYGLRAAAVVTLGHRRGDALSLMRADDTSWTSAAAVTASYARIGLVERAAGDADGAELEYSYTLRGVGVHGVNLLQRNDSTVYVLCWLGVASTWGADFQLKQAFQPSFGLD